MSVPPQRQRVVIDNVRPTVDCGALPAKATEGLPLEVSADIVADGHDMILAWVRHGRLSVDGAPMAKWREQPLQANANDRWSGWFTPTVMGSHGFSLLAMCDQYGSWLRDLRLRHEAGQELELELLEGALMVERTLQRCDGAADRRALQKLGASLRTAGPAPPRVRAAAHPQAVQLMRRAADRRDATEVGPFPLFVDRPLAGFSAWYEFFPRSEGTSLQSAAERLPAIGAMGFDVVYLPPIHPIGTTLRKGPNNTLDAAAEDVGSPWAIGSAAGGHTAVHPDLGTLEDFDTFVERARSAGLEVALDIALQCSPDHPWVIEHPQWFRQRPDGSIRYAENPPKRYQDIYPINLGSDDHERLWAALLEIFLFWIAHGVSVFRVDNPHTKPLPFWRWCIEEVRSRHPETIFLAEAFTRPRVMERLAKFGFTQSYTYFTWRTTKQELAEYLTELSQTPQVDWFRPNFWTNTPDILHEYLQHGGPPAFRSRAVLAALACPSWGMYSGYELFENRPVRPGSEEYQDSEKYQVRRRDWNRPDSLAPLITTLNRIRRDHRSAVAQLRTLRIHHIESDALLCFSRSDEEHRDVLLVVVNLDPFNVRDATTWLDLGALGLAPGDQYLAHDELSGTTYVWQGPANYVRLDPHRAPAHVFHLRAR